MRNAIMGLVCGIVVGGFIGRVASDYHHEKRDDTIEELRADSPGQAAPAGPAAPIVSPYDDSDVRQMMMIFEARLYAVEAREPHVHVSAQCIMPPLPYEAIDAEIREFINGRLIAPPKDAIGAKP